MGTESQEQDLGATLIALRTERDIGRRKLKDLTGLSLSYLHEIENNVYLPSRERLELIADALKIKGSEREQLLSDRDRAELKKLGFEDADVTLLLKEAGPLTDEAREKIMQVLSDVRGKSAKRRSPQGSTRTRSKK